MSSNTKENKLMAFFNFMSSGAGRVTRVVAGLALMLAGLLAGGAGYVLVLVGLVPLAAGAFDLCLFAPLTGRPVRGEEFRSGGSR